ncbi:SpaH/EbpB family LPXTG-anchored major pilin [Enterococcus sp. AZ109]|uniref:SpaH/EbpB family LPXTG-anchored major pilin n=1 Tax=Enterococcus sp. AZ109 TaxID=2774634 RepID=UPI003F6878A3
MLFIATIVMVLPLALGLGSSLKSEAATDGNIDIILHKKRFSSDPSLVQNTGERIPTMDTQPGFGGVTFNVYDATEAFYTALNGGSSMEDALTAVKNADYSSATVAKTGVTATTGSVGDVTLENLPAKSGGKNAVYVIVETEMAGVTKADNMVVALPVKNVAETADLTEIHLYPKNVVATAGIEVEKVSNLDNATKLEGVIFNIHRGGKYNEPGTEYLSGFDASGTPTWSTVASEAHPFDTDENGKFKEERLLYGTYYLTEISSVSGYVIQNGAVNKPFTLSAANTSVSFTGDDNAIRNDKLEVTKTNTGGSVNVGDKIDYKVTSQIPDGIRDEIDTDADGVNDAPRYTKYVITDTHGVHLKLGNFAITDGATPPLTSPEHYTLDSTNVPGQFTVTFTPDGIKRLTPGATLTMTYQMELLKSVAPGEEVNNTAKIETDHDTDEGPGSKVYTGGYNFIKVDGSNDKAALKGAEFVVRDGSDKATAKYLVIGTNGEVSWTTVADDATPFTSNEDGYVTVRGLADGIYYLQETKTPTDKYVLLEEMTKFEVTQNSFNTTNPLANVPGTTELGKPAEVINLQEGSLPSTGGTGIYVMVALGLAVMSIAGVWYVRSQRKEA